MINKMDFNHKIKSSAETTKIILQRKNLLETKKRGNLVSRMPPKEQSEYLKYLKRNR